MSLIIVCGATATGKSELAVSLAKEINAEVVNADSMQVYKGMDIGTAKLTSEERGGISHHLIDILDIKDEFVNRYLNEGFSGGEKKRMEMLQMLVLEPKLSILDETDSGLDVDALKVVSKAVNYLVEKNGMSVVVITHYTRILNYIKPEFVHVLKDGKIIKEGGEELAHEIESQGYKAYEN